MIFTDSELVQYDLMNLNEFEQERLVSTVWMLVGRVSAAEQVCLNVGQFFELPDEERKSRLKGSLDRWRRARNG